MGWPETRWRRAWPLREVSRRKGVTTRVTKREASLAPPNGLLAAPAALAPNGLAPAAGLAAAKSADGAAGGGGPATAEAALAPAAPSSPAGGAGSPPPPPPAGRDGGATAPPNDGAGVELRRQAEARVS